MNLLTDLKKSKGNILKKENIFSLILISTIFLLDRYSKIIIIKDFSDQKFFLNDFLNLDLIWNTGIGFGLLASNSSMFYNFITFLIGAIILTLLYIVINSKNLDKIIFSIIIGGALGNFYDRLVFKAVPDFIDFHIGDFHWFIFNFADVFITLGVFFMILLEIIDNNKNKNEYEKF